MIWIKPGTCLKSGSICT